MGGGGRCILTWNVDSMISSSGPTTLKQAITPFAPLHIHAEHSEHASLKNWKPRIDFSTYIRKKRGHFDQLGTLTANTSVLQALGGSH